jgi:hypothetical protein
MFADITWSLNIRATDIAIVLATLAGPFLAVYVTERQRKRSDARNRKIHIFRTLMATRSAPLAQLHIESLNLVEVEFDRDKSLEKEVVDNWRLYLAHLNDKSYPQDAWGPRKVELLIELLHAMAKALGYSYSKAEIKGGTYYPAGWMNTENENAEIRTLWLSILRGNAQLPMKAEVYTNQSPPPSTATEKPINEVKKPN